MKKFKELLNRFFYFFKSKENKKIADYKKDISQNIETILNSCDLIFMSDNCWSDFLTIFELEKLGHKLTKSQKEKQTLLMRRHCHTEYTPLDLLQDVHYVDILIHTDFFKNTLNLAPSQNSAESREYFIGEIAKNKNSYQDSLLEHDFFQKLYNKKDNKLQKIVKLIDLLEEKEFEEKLVKEIKKNLKDLNLDRVIFILNYIILNNYTNSPQKAQNLLIDIDKTIRACPELKAWIQDELKKIDKTALRESEFSLIEKTKIAYKQLDLIATIKSTKGIEHINIDKSLEYKIKALEKKINDYLKNDNYREEKTNLEDLLNNVFISSVKNYYSIEADFRETLKNKNGQTAKDLLEENFLSIEKSLLIISESINEKRLNIFTKDTSINQKVLGLSK